MKGDPHEGLVMLGEIVDALGCISRRLQGRDDVTVMHGRAAALAMSTAPSRMPWEVTLEGENNVVATDADAVLLATGAVPAPLPQWCIDIERTQGGDDSGDGGAPRIVSGELAVDAAQLAAQITQGEKIALLGTSHSAALVAMHLENMEWPSEDLQVFSPAPAKQADWIQPGQYHWSATGKKRVKAYLYCQRRFPSKKVPFN